MDHSQLISQDNHQTQVHTKLFCKDISISFKRKYRELINSLYMKKNIEQILWSTF